MVSGQRYGFVCFELLVARDYFCLETVIAFNGSANHDTIVLQNLSFLHCYLFACRIVGSAVAGNKWIKGNAGQYGFYRVTYDTEGWNDIIKQMNENHTVCKKIEPGDFFYTI